LDKLPETRLVTERESEMIHLLACQLQHFVEGDCRRFVDHYISSNDGLVIRLGCSNSQAVGCPFKSSDRLVTVQRKPEL
jgi:hypothetical protein